MKKKISLLLAAALLLTSAAVSAAAEEDRITAFSENFDDYDASMWKPADGTEPSFISDDGNTFYSVTATDYVKFPYVDYLKNFTVEFDMKFKRPAEGTAYPSFYLKSMGEPTRYNVFFAADPSSPEISLKRGLDGVVKSVSYDVLSLEDTWTYVKLVVEDGYVDVYVNDPDTPVLSYKDESPLVDGPLGIYKGGCEYLYIDNFTVSIPASSADDLTGGTVTENKTTPNTYTGDELTNDFSSDSIAPLEDLAGKSEITVYNGESRLSLGERARLSGFEDKNFSVEFDMTFTDFTLSNTPMTLFYLRYTDDKNYYSIEMNPACSALELYKTENGVKEEWPVFQSGIFYSPDVTRTFRFDFYEDTLALYVKSAFFPNFEHRFADTSGLTFTKGDFIFARPENVGKLLIDNLRVREISVFGNLGDRPSETAPLYTPALAPEESYSDISSHAEKDTISYLVNTGILSGYSDNTIRPDAEITVAEFIKLLVSAQGIEVTPVSGADWAKPYIDAACSAGYITKCTFEDYNRTLLRSEMLLVLNKLTGGDSAQAGILTGSIEDGAAATRADAAATIMRLITPSYRLAENTVTIAPAEYEPAFKNPLKGFRGAAGDEYVSIIHSNIFYNELESNVNDGVEKFKEVCDEKWAGLAEQNIKVTPRVILEWPPDGKYWPSDMTVGDYSSDEFIERIQNFIAKMGEAWDNDPRVAYVQVGLIGYWGEMQSPYPTVEVQQAMSKAFAESFKNKKVMVNISNRYAFFNDNDFGVSWDSYGHWWNLQMLDYFESEKFCDAWKFEPIGGETAFDWGDTLGKNPDDALLNYLPRYIELFRGTHCNHIGWISGYDPNNEAVQKNAQVIQKLLGYRFVIDRFSCTANLDDTRRLDIAFSVKNTGSTPLYYNWPIEVTLLDPETHEPVWKDTIKNTDVTKWLPEDNYSYDPLYNVSASFEVPQEVSAGEYIVALTILDPDGGMLPAIRFANENYFNGGRTPLARIGVGVSVENHYLDSSSFDDIQQDKSLYYTVG